jgi:hypothetical protein
MWTKFLLATFIKFKQIVDKANDKSIGLIYAPRNSFSCGLFFMWAASFLAVWAPTTLTGFPSPALKFCLSVTA